MMRRRTSQHTEWLSLVESSGPFLAVSVLESVFPQGMATIETPVRRHVRSAYEEWREAVDEGDELLERLHQEWVRLVLVDLLEFEGSVLANYRDEDPRFSVSSPDGTASFAPDFALTSGSGNETKLFISVQPPGTDLEKVRAGDGWPASVVDRMTLLCRSHEIRLGLLTNGDRWMLVNAPVGSTSGHTSWYARLWFQEPVTLQAFQSLLGIRRWFGPEAETLPAMLDASLANHEEVTDTLGEQVKRAVEVLIQCLDRADQDRNRELLHDVEPAQLYEAGLTVMMRLVFVLCAEERGLLLLDDPVYDQNYAVSTLRGQLEQDSDQHGPEVLERRHDAWSRLLAVFRAVYGGVEHETLRMPALGGSLFDPDRFPFLEGRAKGTKWTETPAQPLPIDNRTVLLLLTALQVLEQKNGALLLSYKALDVEQVGHVYEGLLEHTVRRLPQVTLGLVGSQKAKNPNLPLPQLESAALDGQQAVVDLVKEATQRSIPAIRNALEKDVDDPTFGRVLLACGGDVALAERIRPFANLVRPDAWDEFIVYPENAFAVTLGADRRETGTHYTPKSLTETIVQTTLEPVAYVGPADGLPREEWKLKSSAELLDLKVCDPAMGSGAFLVQVCRYLSERVVEAWGHASAAGKFISADGEVLDTPGEADPLPGPMDDRLTVARRLVAERCLYGVDLNPLAVELAKLSIWLVTLARGRPFGFLDHNLRCGDSLLGLHRLDQLTRFLMRPDETAEQYLFARDIETIVNDAMDTRALIRRIRVQDIRDVCDMADLYRETCAKLGRVERVADAMMGEVLRCGGKETKENAALSALLTHVAGYLGGDGDSGGTAIEKARENLAVHSPSEEPRRPFHWALEFPEALIEGGFDAVVGNPPFMGGKKITGNLGVAYRNYILNCLAGGQRGNADLCAYFLLRSASLLRPNGHAGLLATNTIAQGDTREVGLQQLEERGFSIPAAVPSQKWPGHANLEVAIVWLHHGNWGAACNLNGKPVDGISSYLTPPGVITGHPYRLKANGNKSFQGSVVLGMGFVLAPEAAQELIMRNPRNRDVLFPYLNGQDLNSRPDQSPSRWVINFFDWPLRRDTLSATWEAACEKQRREWLRNGTVPTDYPGPVAADYPDCLSIVEEKVKPERDELGLKKDSTAQGYARLWWQYGRRGVNLYSTIARMDRFLVHPLTSKHHSLAFYGPGIVSSHMTVVLAVAGWQDFATVQCEFHWQWALMYGNKLETRPQYTPTDCFETFPFPFPSSSSLADVGECYYGHRQNVMQMRQEGLTATYNRFHDANETDLDIQRLRELQMKIDEVVAAAYHWEDLDLGHGFHNTKQGIRFTIIEAARIEALQRLLKLNHERYTEEVAQGHEPGASG